MYILSRLDRAPRRGLWILLFATIVLASLPLASSAQPSSAQPGHEAYDRYGRIILDADGQRYVYGEEETEALKALHPDEKKLLPISQDSLLSHAQAVASKISKSTNPLGIEREWHRRAFGPEIGEPGIRFADLDGDGQKEMIVASYYWWHVLQPESNGTFKQVFASDQRTVFSLITQDWDGDGDDEIIVGDYDGDSAIRVFDGLPPTQIQSYPVQNPARSLQIADLEQDGDIELIHISVQTISILDPSTGIESYKNVPGVGSLQDMGIGNLDSDPALEIAVVGGSPFSTPSFRIVDGATLQIEEPNGVDADVDHRVTIHDVDGDGDNEIVGVQNWEEIRVIEWAGDGAGTATLAFSIPIQHDVNALEIADWDSDGSVEILYGDAQWGSVWAHDGATGQLEFEIENALYGVNGLAVGDADLDGDLDLVWGVGGFSDPPERLLVHDLSSLALIWRSPDYFGPFRGMAAADVDLDGQQELISSCSAAGSGSAPVWFVHDAATKDLEYTSHQFSVWDSRPVTRIRIAQNDLDPQPEIFVAAGSHPNAEVYVYDGNTHLQEASIGDEYGLSILAMEVVDVDEDGLLELVVGRGRFDGNRPEAVFADVYDAATGSLEWRFPLYPDYAHYHYLRVANIDDDGQQEMIFGVAYGTVRVFDGVTKSEQWSMSLNASSFDVSEDGQLFVGTEDGAVLRIDGNSGSTLETVLQTVGPIHSLRARDFDYDGSPEFTFVADGRFRILSSDGVELFGEHLGIGTAINDAIVIDDVDDDGHTEIWLALGESASGSLMYQVGFTAADASPMVAIAHPTQGGTVDAGAPVLLQANADDLVDGDLTPYLLWSSDLFGSLGSGGSLEVFLPLGTHVITAEVADSSGNLGLASVTFDVTAPAGSVADAVARWRFDEGAGSTAFDVTGNGHDAALQSGATFGPGIELGALSLDGVDDHATANSSAALDSLTSFTATAWVRHERVSAWRSVVDKRDAGSDGFDLYLERSGRGFVRVNSATLTGTTGVDDGTWHHLAAVYDGGGIEIYVDGVLDASNTVSAGALSTTGPVWLGRNFSSGSQFGGEMDDVRLYSRALSAAEIATVYDEMPPQRSDGAPTGLLPSGSGSATLSLITDEAADCRYSETPGVDYAAMVNVFSQAGGTQHTATVGPLADGTGYAFYVRCQDAAGHPNLVDLAIEFHIAGPGDIDLGLAGHWPLDEGAGSLAGDVSGLGHDGTIIGAAWISDAGGTALDFAGSGDAIAVGSSPVFATPTTVTMAAWVQLGAGSSGWRSVIDVRDSNTDGYDLFIDDQSRAFIRVNTHKLSGQTMLADGSWHHIVGVYDGERLKLYVDGVLDAELSVGATTISTSGALRIGDHFTASGSFGFVGAIDEVRVYDRVLGPAEVAALASP